MLVFALTGCGAVNGNMSIVPDNYTYDGVHIISGNSFRDCTVLTWYETSKEGIEVDTKEYGSLFLSAGTYILYSDECPICGGRK